MSLGYLVLIAGMVGNHALEGLFSRRRYMWTVIAFYAWFCLFVRVVFQLPLFKVDIALPPNRSAPSVVDIPW